MPAYNFYDSPGDLWSAYLNFYYNRSYPLSYVFPNATISTFNGRRALQIDVDGGGAPLDIFVLNSIGAAEKAPARFFLDSPGFSGSSWLMSAIPDDFDIEFLVAVWTNEIVSVKKAIIDGWSDGSCLDTSLASTSSLSDRFISIVASFPVLTVREALVSVEQGRIMHEVAPDLQTMVGSASGVSCGSPSAVLSVSTAGIQTSLSDISKREITLSTGNEGPFVSVFGRSQGS